MKRNSDMRATGRQAFASSQRALLLQASAALLLVLLTSATARAETRCGEALQAAERSYELGLFEDIQGQLTPCIESRMSRSTAVRVHSLLAKAHLFSEELEKARQEVSALLRIDSTFEPGPPPRFAELVARVRREEQTAQVASVSKTSESLREAPATVIVVTGEEIERRGYLDLEELLHDLPGFDFSRSNGAIYSQVYQRGYNSFLNDRILLLVDGVEQNDLSANTMYLSRQYPLRNINRVEIVYGPASTMYGANAYTGVISVLTKSPESVVGEGERFGLVADAGAGGLDTRFADMVVAGRNRSGTMAWSIAGRFHRSDERDLSGFGDWDYNYDSLDYKAQMRLTGFLAELFFLQGHCAAPSPLFTCSGEIPFLRSVELTDAGEAVARELDRRLVADNDLWFEDGNENTSLNAKLQISNLTVGLQVFRSQEGLGTSNRDTFASGRTNWTPRHTALYFRYSRPAAKNISFNAFTRYLQSDLERANSRYEYLHAFANGFLSIFSLVPPCITPGLDPKPVGCPPASPWFERVTFGTVSSQIRSEFNIVYDPSARLSAVAGVEFAQSSIQSQIDQRAVGPGELTAGNFEAPEQIQHVDLSIYAQASYRLRADLKGVVAGRVNYNEINNKPGAAGFGTLFTPRLGLIYTPLRSDVVLKAIYSEAFKDPADLQKFSIIPFVNNVRSTGLDPERVRNLELSALWEPGPRVSIEAAAYQADYSDVVSLAAVTREEILERGYAAACPEFFLVCSQYRNSDELEVRGLQMTGSYRGEKARLWGNYTYTRARQTRPAELRVAAIAGNKASLGVDFSWTDRWSTSLRTRFVGDREVGPGTTFPGLPLGQLDAYTTAELAATYRNAAPGLSLQLVVRNLLDEDYYDTSGSDFAGTPPQILQAGRTAYLVLKYVMAGREETPRP